jgi:hypothetical protein
VISSDLNTEAAIFLPERSQNYEDCKHHPFTRNSRLEQFKNLILITNKAFYASWSHLGFISGVGA